MIATKERASTEGAVYFPPGATSSLAAFEEWYDSDDFPEEGRICYLAGELFIDMGHERISSHVSLKTTLSRMLDELAEEIGVGQFFGDGVRVVNFAADLSAEPDGCYVTYKSVKSKRVVLKKSFDGEDVTRFVGTPDMVLEIVSPSSIRKDKRLLRKIYHSANIPEYWLIDARKAEVSFELFRHTNKGYVLSMTKDGWLASKTFNREFRITRSKNQIGVWRYKLHIRMAKQS